MAIPINDVKPGVTVQIGGELFRCLEFHQKRAAQQTRIKIKLKNLRSGAIVDKTFNTGEKIELAHIDYKQMQFLYSDQNDFHFMDQTTYEQISLARDKIGEAAKYLKEGFVVTISFYENEILDVNLPAAVELKVVETSPGFKGDTVSGGKPATMETGVVVQVPFFVNVGDVLKIDTRDGKYLGRA
ncbi:elongation factor P [candidate division WOR-1 bacterium DG_54_3]|uniref:Elongation factor P n=1 Tax=candidate division WOR-1 bacterium DG_54_3 TaxID=1703775 RepID=A0A0S7XT68_UNCSA|nr:MAG: elongation factor P [candidate division WOR-1 bacterium DG_54_3]